MKRYNQIIFTSLLSLCLVGQSAMPVAAFDLPEPPTAPTPPPVPPQEEAPPPAPTPPPVPGLPGDEPETQAESPTQPEPEGDRDRGDRDEDETEDQTPTESQATGSETNETSSGGETDSGNVGDTEIDTGNASSTATVVTLGNNNSASTIPGGSGSTTLANTGNGAGSDNSGSFGVTNDSTTIQTNTAVVSNSLSQSATTGDNEASNNVGDSTIETGDANVTGTVVTAVNTNVDGIMVAEFNIADDHVGDIILDFGSACISGCGTPSSSVINSQNGAESNNSGEVSYDNESTTFQTNVANLDNTLTLSADSGNNEADRNTVGDNTITTGDANVAANLLTLANNNLAGNVIYGVVNIFGDLIGDIIFPAEAMTTLANTGNGAGSNNSASLETEVNDATFQNNTADITNSLTFDANTGNNETSRNTGGNNTVTTGDTEVKAAVTNLANLNILGDTWLVLVNEAGQWLGKIMGADPGATYAGSVGLEFMVLESGEVVVTNSGNGANSTNTAAVTNASNNTLVQTNQAVVNNNLNLSANTGGNSASRNTGGDNTITTGDATIVANIMNFVNNNIAGSGRLFITVVNVFGSWRGNFFGPGQEKAATEVLTQGAEPAAPPAAGRGGLAAVESTANQEDTTEVVEVVEPVSSPRLAARLARLNFGSSIINSQLESNEAVPQAVAAGSQAVFGSASAKKVIHVNLAWLMLLAPVMAVSLYTWRRKVKI